MKNFEKHQERFNRDFNRAKKWSLVSVIIIWSIWLGLAGFGVWVIIMVMRFFEVI